MTPSRRLFVAAAVLVVAAALGCTSPPDKELHQAEGALDTARAAGAPRYASEEFEAASAALSRATTAVGERDYKLALNYALDARERALVAARVAAEERVRVRSQVEQQLADIDTARRSLDARLDEAEAAKVARKWLTSGRASSAKVTTALAEARPLLDAGDDDAAAALLKPLHELLAKARSEIDAAIESRNTRRPARRTRG